MKKFFITAVITFSLFLGNVKAIVYENDNYYLNNLKYNNNDLTTFDFIYVGGAANRKLSFDLVPYGYQAGETLYITIVLCSDTAFSGDGYGSSEISNLKFYNSNYSCNYNDSSYTGGTIRMVAFNLKTGPGNEFSGYYYWYQVENGSLQLVDFVVSSSQFASIESYSSQDLINKNSQIINQNNTIINQGQQTNDKLDDLNSKQDKTNQELKNMNDFISDDTEADVDVSSLATVTGLLPAGPVDSLLTIPLKFLSVLSSSFSGTCTPVTMNWVFDSQLTLPCFSDSFYNDVPSAIMTFLSIVPCAFILITYFKHLYKKVDRAVSMNTTADDEWGVI